MPRRRSVLSFPSPSLLLMILLLTATAAQAGPVTVTNPAEAPAAEVLDLREVWRAGGDDDGDVLLGRIGVVASGPGGEVYALDSQLCEVQVFDAGGGHLRTLGREGEGPGEFRQPIGLFLPGDGTVGVQQPFPGKVEYLDAAEGTPLGSWRLGSDDPTAGGFVFVQTARKRGGTFVASGATSAFDMATQEIRSTSFLALVNDGGAETERLYEVSTVRSMVRFTIDELRDFNPGDRGLWDIGPDGRLWVADAFDRYALTVYGPGGQVQRTITRDYTARERTDEEKEEIRGSMQMNINGQVPEIDWVVQDRAQCIERLQVLDDGTVWIRNSHAGVDWPDEGRVTYDVLDAEGRLQREVTVAVPGGGEGDRLVLLDDGRFMLIKGLDSLSISISAGDGDEVEATDESLGDALLELVCFEPVR